MALNQMDFQLLVLNAVEFYARQSFWFKSRIDEKPQSAAVFSTR